MNVSIFGTVGLKALIREAQGSTLQCGPVFHYSVDLRIQTYTELVPLQYGKLATKYPWIYKYFYGTWLTVLLNPKILFYNTYCGTDTLIKVSLIHVGGLDPAHANAQFLNWAHNPHTPHTHNDQAMCRHLYQ